MIKSIKKNINNLSKVTAYLIKYGVAFCCLIMIITAFAYTGNINSNYYRPEITGICKNIALMCTGMFAEIIIGAIIIDIYQKRTIK